MARIMTIGRHFKVSVLGYELEQKLVTGGFQTEVSCRVITLPPKKKTIRRARERVPFTGMSPCSG
jgi:hypothetical protein